MRGLSNGLKRQGQISCIWKSPLQMRRKAVTWNYIKTGPGHQQDSGLPCPFSHQCKRFEYVYFTSNIKVMNSGGDTAFSHGLGST